MSLFPVKSVLLYVSGIVQGVSKCHFDRRYVKYVHSNTAFFQTKGKTLTHPFGIFIWRPPFTQFNTGSWLETLQAYSEEFALYVANLIHKDSQAVVKVVREGITLASFPDEKTVEFFEQQIAKQQEQK